MLLDQPRQKQHQGDRENPADDGFDGDLRFSWGNYIRRFWYYVVNQRIGPNFAGVAPYFGELLRSFCP